MHNDLLTLVALRQDCRIKHTALAQRHGWPVSSTHERVRRCLAAYTTRTTTLLENDGCGAPITTWFIVRPTPHSRLAWLERALRLPNINTLTRCQGGDYLVQALCRDRHEEAFVHAVLQCNAKLVAHPVIENIFRERMFTSADDVPALGFDTATPSAPPEMTKQTPQ